MFLREKYSIITFCQPIIYLLCLPLLLFPPTTRAELNIPEQSLIRIRGQALSLPGQFGKQFFYFYHRGEVVQVYNYWQRFPDFKLFDYLEIKAIFSQIEHYPRLKTKEITDIITINQGGNQINNELPVIRKQEDLEKQAKISLIKVTGKIEKIGKNNFKIKNDFAEFSIDLQHIFEFKVESLSPSDKVTIEGLLFKKTKELRLYPLRVEDIKIQKGSYPTTTSTLLAATKKEDAPSKKPFLKYLGLILTCALIFIIIRKP